MKKKCKAHTQSKFFNESIAEEDLIAPTNTPSKDAFFVCKDCYNELKDLDEDKYYQYLEDHQQLEDFI